MRRSSQRIPQAPIPASPPTYGGPRCAERLNPAPSHRNSDAERNFFLAEPILKDTERKFFLAEPIFGGAEPFFRDTEPISGGAERIPGDSERNKLFRNADSTLSERIKKLPSKRISTPARRCAGMTMIELSLVMGIVSLLLALTLALSRHVSAVSNIRMAQTDLGAWHEALQQWFIRFGEYPAARISEDGSEEDLLQTGSGALYNLSNIATRAEVRLDGVGDSSTNVTFRSCLPSGVKIRDPWGQFYVYECDGSRRAYTLLSCGPDRKSEAIGGASSTSRDDIFFER